MKVVCAWCNTEMESVAGAPTENVSHGMCDSCLQSFERSEYSFSGLQEFLNSLDQPILSVSENGVVVAANPMAQKTLEMTAEEIEGRLGGEVMSCAYHQLPGGCGNTIHCTGCTIRNSVMNTLKTGKPLDNVKAYQLMEMNGETVEMVVPISTRKVGEVVVLKIGDMHPARPSQPRFAARN